jgi:UV DNA damage endonuclease
MSAKRKRDNTGDATLHSATTNPKRRSRRIEDRYTTITNENVPTGAQGVPDRRSTSPSQSSQETWKSQADMQRAIHHLQEMESELQSVVKRQQLAIETSSLNRATESTPEAERLPKDPDHHVLNEDEHNEPNSVEQAPLDRRDAELAEGDVVAARDDDAVERGARRAPPVNSERLPLPWSGRLGYVRRSTLKQEHGLRLGPGDAL